MKFIIHTDGSFDLLGAEFRLLDCYPAVNGRPLRPLGVEAAAERIVYRLPEGRVELRFRTEADGRLILDCAAAGLPGIHDLSPLDAAVIEGAERVFVQGQGMEGPSGDFALAGKEVPPASHGLTALHAGDRTFLAYGEDHRRYSLSFQASVRETPFGAAPRFRAVFNLEGTAGEAVILPSLFFEEAGGLASALNHCARRIAAAMGARKKQPPAFFWSSWYHAYETMDQAALEQTLSEIRKAEIPFQYIELDAGYTPHLGDWLTPNHRWPGGLKRAAETIRAAGFQAGVWVGPFIVGDSSELYRTHPDWVLHGPDGKPVVQLRSYTEPKIWGNPDCDYYILDASHPGALAYLQSVFETLRGWGFTFFKTDFMLWNMRDSATVRRYDPSLTSVEILRRVLDTVRAAIGEESYLLGCIAPFLPFVGYADGMRLAGDCGAQWAEPYGPVNLLRELPCDNYFNHVFWQNDPDAMLLRDRHTHLSPTEVRSLALLQALSGGAVSTSDPIGSLSADRKRLLRFVEPKGAVTPELPYLGQRRRELVFLHRLSREKSLLFVLNPTEEPLTVAFRFAELLGEGSWYRTAMDWEAEAPESVREEVWLETLAPHASALLFLTERPLERLPENLWNW